MKTIGTKEYIATVNRFTNLHVYVIYFELHNSDHLILFFPPIHSVYSIVYVFSMRIIWQQYKLQYKYRQAFKII